MATFKTFEKAFKFVSLYIEGTFGEGYTLTDLQIDKTTIKDDMKYSGLSIVVIRKTGAQAGFQTQKAAEDYARKWSNPFGTITFRKNENKEFEVEILVF